MYARRFLILPVAIAALAMTTRPYSDGPPVGHTGGFGEPTCHRCHFDNPPDDPETSLVLGGFPSHFEIDSSYGLSIRLESPGMKAGGFQLSARYSAGADSGKQAGRLRPVDGTVQVSATDSSGVEYASHSEAAPTVELSFVEWRLVWVAPASPGPVAFHVAANAANGDESEFGDHIVFKRRALDAMGGAGANPSSQSGNPG